MFKKVFLLILAVVFSVLVFAVEPIFKYPLPDFVLKKEFLKGTIPFNSRIDFKISHNFKKVVLINGYYDSLDEALASNMKIEDLQWLKDNLDKKDKIWLSKVLFLNEDNQIIKERVFPNDSVLDLIDYSQNPVIAITKLKNHGNYVEQIKTDFYDFNGNFLKSFDLKNRQELFLFKSCDNNFYYFASYIDVDLAGYFEVYPVKDLFRNIKNNHHNEERYILNFKNGAPSAFLLLGGEDVKAVFAKGATIKMIGLKNGNEFWKIENAGANISDIHLNDENQIVVDAYPPYILIEPETGEIITKINRKKIIAALKPITKKKRIAIGRPYKTKDNKLILPAYQLASPNRFEIVINNFNKKDSEKSIILYEVKKRYQLPKRKTIIKKNNKIYYATVEDKRLLVIYSLPLKDFTFKKKLLEKTILSLN